MSTESVLLLVALVTVPACIVAFAAGALWASYVWKQEADRRLRCWERWERSLREQQMREVQRRNNERWESPPPFAPPYISVYPKKESR